jgi:hypothetical protein
MLLANGCGSPEPARRDGVLVGTLVGFVDMTIPLVIYPGQPGTAALAARSTVVLSGEHIGSEVVLLFDDGDPAKPLVMGRLVKAESWHLPERVPQVEADADGLRLTLVAKEQLVLQCGKASITLTKAGKLLMRGTYISGQSDGLIRIKGGAVQIN